MFRLSARQWLLLAVLLLLGGAMQVAWILRRPEPPRRAHPVAPLPAPSP
jgi:hypothetical protein